MGKVTSEISMSLDGFIAGPSVGVGNGMGDDGDRLHDWRFDAKTPTDIAIVDEIYASSRAVVIGKRMFDVGFEPWGVPPPFGMPVFVVTHEARQPLPMQGDTTYTFVTDGIEAALEQARDAAGDKNVGIWGGANIIRQYLSAGLLDEMQVLIPLLLGDGIRLFEDLGPVPSELRRTTSAGRAERAVCDCHAPPMACPSGRDLARRWWFASTSASRMLHGRILVDGGGRGRRSAASSDAYGPSRLVAAAR